MSIDYEDEVKEWLNLQMVTGRYSSALVQQLAEMIENRSGHSFKVYDEIASLERAPHARRTGTKLARPLTGLLAGFQHKHYVEPAFLFKNILNVVHSNRFDETARRVMDNDNISSERKIDHLIHEIAILGYEQRSRDNKLTGEWIVFKRYNRRNYYLTLGRHGERNEAILERIFACRDEFPELKLTATPNHSPSLRSGEPSDQSFS